MNSVVSFYVDGFRNMRLGRTLWAIIFFKLIILFGLMKIFFCQDFLAARFSSDEAKASYVLEQLTDNYR